MELNFQKTLRVIDLPGHERLRTQMLDEHKGLARSVLFVTPCFSLFTALITFSFFANNEQDQQIIRICTSDL